MKIIISLLLILQFLFACETDISYRREDTPECPEYYNYITTTEIINPANRESLADIARYMASWCGVISDQEQFGVGDYWQTEYELIKNKAGDCEDRMIYMLMMARKYGFGFGTALFVYIGDEISHVVACFNNTIFEFYQIVHGQLLIRIIQRKEYLENHPFGYELTYAQIVYILKDKLGLD